MYSNKWMFFCLFGGILLSVATMSSIPIYTEGILQRMLIKDLEASYQSSSISPGLYSVAKKQVDFKRDAYAKNFEGFMGELEKTYNEAIGLPILTKSIKVENSLVKGKDARRTDKNNKYFHFNMRAFLGLEEHIELIGGKLPSKTKVYDVYEVIMNEYSMKSLGLAMDKEYLITNAVKETSKSIKVKVVGVFKGKNYSDDYWQNIDWKNGNSLIMEYSLFMNEYLKEDIASLEEFEYNLVFDYHKLKIKKLASILQGIEGLKDKLSDYEDVKTPSLEILRAYEKREKSLGIMLMVLQTPILIMILFYIFMIAQLIVEKESNEIAVLKSRGASRSQIIKGYFAESLILGITALVIGPFLGLTFCSVIGSSNGFLEFIQRKRIEFNINLKSLVYAVIAVVFFVITLLIPVFFSTRATTIVKLKQKKSRLADKVFWERYYIDVLLLLISSYGIYAYRNKLDILRTVSIQNTEMPVDPLLFAVSTLFIIGIGLLYIRSYPYIIKLLFLGCKKFLSASSYSAFINVNRVKGKQQFIMIFLILTIATGIFNANTARTINVNAEDKVKYSIGADIALKVKWETTKSEASSSGSASTNTVNLSSSGRGALYIEPDFNVYRELRGIELATKVLRKTDGIVYYNQETFGNVYLMGVIPHEFAKVAWFRSDLLPSHYINYLNVMTKDPRGMLVSSSIKEKYGARLGDMINVRWGEDSYVQGIILAFIDYWPTYNPVEHKVDEQNQELVVANLNYIQSQAKLEPYETWMKQKENESSSTLYEDISEKGIEVDTIQNSRQQVIIKKNDPMLQGVNGALTVGFIVTMLITSIGLLIYWIITIKSRQLQFGVLRAMGLTKRSVINMIALEQLLVSGSSIIAGIIIGGMTGKLFTPLLQIVYSSSEQVPPFKVIAYRGDYIKLYIIIILIMSMTFSILGKLIASIKINQAIKLGED
jgi:putative ABC transport system permease protein